MKSNRVFLLFFLLIIASLSAWRIIQHSPIKLDLNIGCSQYMADGFDERGEWVATGMGSFITLDGKIDYNSSTASKLERVVAKITVYDVVSGVQLHDEILIQLNSTGTSVFKKELDFKESDIRDNSFCYDYKYSIAFYSLAGKIVPHIGDFENSVNSPVYFYNTPTPDSTNEALLLTIEAKPHITSTTEARMLTAEAWRYNSPTPNPTTEALWLTVVAKLTPTP